MTAAESMKRLGLIEDLLDSGRRILIALLLIGFYTVGVYMTGCHAGAGQEQSAEELHRADSAIVATAKLAHAAALRVDSAKRVVVARRRDATPAVARSDSLRHIVVALNETTLAVQRTPGTTPTISVVPPEIVQERAADSASIARLTALVAASDSLVARMTKQHGADSLQLAAADEKIEVLERRKAPRCGRKCGTVIGVIGTLTTALVIDHARDILRLHAKRAKPP